VRSGLLTLEQLDELPLFAQSTQVLADHPLAQPGRRLLFETLRRMLSAQVHDLVAATAGGCSRHAPGRCRRRAPAARLAMPARRARRFAELKRFLFAELYRHPQVMQTTDRARTVVPSCSGLPATRRTRCRPTTRPADRPRAVADYIAGMTDRFALREHHRLTGRRLFAL
jgi:dGTPase